MRISDKREFLLLAHEYNGRDVGGWYLSEKLDGFRAFWDGGLTRGLEPNGVPFANNVKGRLVASTGLWSRYGKVISAPSWWLDALPARPLDGELWTGRGSFEKIMSICRKHNPVDSEWQGVKLMVFDTPSPMIWMPGRIHVRDWRVTWTDELSKWVHWRQGCMRAAGRHVPEYKHNSFDAVRNMGVAGAFESASSSWLPQEELPIRGARAEEVVNERFTEFVEAGAEGVMLRQPASSWVPERSHDLLKVKPEAIGQGARILGFRSGKVTSDGSRLLGKMATLLVSWGGAEFEVCGFLDSERELYRDDVQPDTLYYADTCSFKVGTCIDFKYTALTAKGIPRHARYSRV